jgi:hypothetical protein
MHQTNAAWRSKRIRARRQLPKITVGEHAGEVIGATLLRLEMLNRLGAITPGEADQLEALRRIAAAAEWSQL